MAQIYRLENSEYGILAYAYARNARWARAAYGNSKVAKINKLTAAAVAHVEPEQTVYIRLNEVVLATAVDKSPYGPSFYTVRARINLTHREFVVRPPMYEPQMEGIGEYSLEVEPLLDDAVAELDDKIRALREQIQKLQGQRDRLCFARNPEEYACV